MFLTNPLISHREATKATITAVYLVFDSSKLKNSTNKSTPDMKNSLIFICLGLREYQIQKILTVLEQADTHAQEGRKKNS